MNQFASFKKILAQEKVSFENFKNDCYLIKEMVAQIQLLEKHLKIDRNQRKPTQAIPKKATEVRMNKSISRQLAFAKRHLAANEKLFHVKWKKFFEFETESKLCAR